MVKGMSSIHVSIVSSLGRVASSPSSCMSSSPLRCCRVLYPGRVVIPRWCCLIVVFAGVVVTSSLLSSCVLVMLFLCHGLLVLCLSHLSHRRPCPSCIVLVPHHRSVVVLCVSKVGWDEHGGGGTHRGASSLLVSIRGCWPLFVFIFRCSSLSGVALVVIVARDVALPCRRWLFHCWLCAVVVGSQWQQ